MKRKYREVKKWRRTNFMKAVGIFCDHCGKRIEPGSKYERRVYRETSEYREYEVFLILREHLIPGCNQYER